MTSSVQPPFFFPELVLKTVKDLQNDLTIVDFQTTRSASFGLNELVSPEPFFAENKYPRGNYGDSFSSFSIHPFVELSKKLPEELAAIIGNSALTEKEKFQHVVDFISKTFGKEADFIKKVSKSRSLFPFYSHLWKCPEWINGACNFGIARQLALLNRMKEKKIELRQAYDSVMQADIICILITLCTKSMYGLVPIVYPTTFNRQISALRQLFILLDDELGWKSLGLLAIPYVFWKLRKVSQIESWLKSDQLQQSIDIEALKMTKDYEGARHYLRCIQVYNKSGVFGGIKDRCPLIFKDRIKQRIENLELHHCIMEVDSQNKVAENVKSPMEKAIGKISQVFWKIISLFLWPFQFLYLGAAR